MRVPLFTITFFLASCTDIEIKNKVSTSQITTANKPIAEVQTRTEDSLLITSLSLGKIKLGRGFGEVEKLYSKVRGEEMESEGTSWPAKRVDFGNGEWILVESTAGVGIIDRISTNSQKFQTSKGYRVGQKLLEVLKTSENVGLDIDEGFMSVRLYDDNISLQVDEQSEKLFYKKNGVVVTDIRPEARIAVFSIF